MNDCLFRTLMFSALLCGSAGAEKKTTPPNVIIILTDDQGYGDLGCYGAEKIATPHLDQMAAEGVKMTSFYAASSVCSPSRAALLTGRMPKRVGVPGVFFPYSTTGLSPQEVTMAELLKTQGYRTAIVGKWHLGHRKEFLPLNQGFDSYLGIPYSNDMSIAPELEIAPDVNLIGNMTVDQLNQDVVDCISDYKKVRKKVPLMRDNLVIEYPVDQTTLTRRYTEEALKFIQADSDQPFFLYLAHAMPHTPLHIEKARAGTSQGGLYGDVMEQIDWSVGKILTALKTRGLDQNTLVLFSSDNGPWPKGGSAGPFRGGKFSTYEGGHRVPAIFWGPGLLNGGRVSDAMASSMDVFPTIAHYSGATVPTDRIYDGADLSGVLMGASPSDPRSEFFYYVANTEVIDGVRIGNWKYLLRGHKLKNMDDVTPRLFNLDEDPRERKNQLSQHPELAKKLEHRMQVFDAEVKAAK